MQQKLFLRAEDDAAVQLVVDYLAAAATASSTSESTTERPKEEELVVIGDESVLPEAARQRPISTPALQIDNDTMIVGTRAVLFFLARSHPQREALLLAGSTAVARAEIDQWISFCATAIRPALAAANTKATRTFARALNEFLATRTYFVGQRLSLADLVVYANVYPYLAGLQRKQRFEVPNLSRWFDLIQHSRWVKLNQPKLDIDLDENVLRLSTASSATTTTAAAAAPAAAGAKPKKDAKEAKSEDKEAKKIEVSKPKGADAPPPEEGAEDSRKKAKKEKKPAADTEKKEGDGKGSESAVDISRIDLRVGHIVEVQRHPDAEFLYLEKIDIGEPEPRQVVSGLVKWYSLEEMQNRDIIVVCNMKPAALKGIQSFAMVLCAKSKDETMVEFVNPPPGSKPGDRVFCKGFVGTPDPVLNPKKKIFEQVKEHLTTNDEKVACYKGIPLESEKGLCVANKVANGSLS